MKKFTSIKSVLYDLSLTIDPSMWNQKTMTEWILKGLRKTDSESIYKNEIYYAIIENHKVKLPVDIRYINQVVYHNESTSSKENSIDLLKRIIRSDNVPDTLILQSNPSQKWVPLKLNASPFSELLFCDDMYECANCEHEYIIDESMTLTTDLRKGIIAVSYKAYAKDDDENYLMPDDEDLKEALMYYCLYRYMLSKLTTAIGNPNLLKFYQTERINNLKMFEMLKTKYVGKSNAPDISKMENIKSITNRLVPRGNAFNNLFTSLNKQEKIKHA